MRHRVSHLDVAKEISDGPTDAELAALEAEWPLIEAELELLDAQLVTLEVRAETSPLVHRRLRRAERRVLSLQHLRSSGDHGSGEVAA